MKTFNSFNKYQIPQFSQQATVNLDDQKMVEEMNHHVKNAEALASEYATFYNIHNKLENYSSTNSTPKTTGFSITPNKHIGYIVLGLIVAWIVLDYITTFSSFDAHYGNQSLGATSFLLYFIPVIVSVAVAAASLISIYASGRVDNKVLKFFIKVTPIIIYFGIIIVFNIEDETVLSTALPAILLSMLFHLIFWWMDNSGLLFQSLSSLGKEVASKPLTIEQCSIQLSRIQTLIRNEILDFLRIKKQYQSLFVSELASNKTNSTYLKGYPESAKKLHRESGFPAIIFSSTLSQIVSSMHTLKKVSMKEHLTPQQPVSEIKKKAPVKLSSDQIAKNINTQHTSNPLGLDIN